MFDSPQQLGLGLATGFIFGFLLQKGNVTKFNVIVGQFLLRDFTMLKVMLSAIIVGGIGIYAMHAFELVNLHIKENIANGVVLGGLIFGVGMVVLGYCPGTAVAAAGQGSRDAAFGVLGMLVGAAVYAEGYAYLLDNVLKVNYGKTTLPEMSGIPPWGWFVLLIVFALGLFLCVDIDPWTTSIRSAIKGKRKTSS